MKRLTATQDGPRIVFAFGGHWAICPECLWDSGEARTRGAAMMARRQHQDCTGKPPAHYSTQRIQENQVMLSDHP